MSAPVGRAELPLVVFTVLGPAAAGIVVADTTLRSFGGTTATAPSALPVALALLVAGFLVATLHLGRPLAAGRALANAKNSPLSTEILVGAAFATAIVAFLLRPEPPWGEWPAAVIGLAFVHAMARIYRIRTVPAWDSPATPAAFFGTAIALGASTTLALGAADAAAPALAAVAAASALATPAVAFLHLRRFAVLEARARVHRFRIATAAAAAAALGIGSAGAAPAVAYAAALALLLASELAGRALFYASHRRVGL